LKVLLLLYICSSPYKVFKKDPEPDDFHKSINFSIGKAFLSLNLFTKNKGFFIPYFLFLVVGLFLILQYTEKEILDTIVSSRTPALTAIAKLLTYTGDGLFFIFTIILLAFFKLRFALTGLIAWAIQGLIVQISKRYFFEDYTRPVDRFKDSVSDYVIEGYEHHSLYSFPSGHSSTAFCMFLLLALFVTDKRWGLVFFLLALVIALTRPYLAQHFFIDIYAGSLVGVFAAIVAYILIYKPDTQHIHSWLDRPVTKLKG
jgi:membrane-associated phospholipid phosphatase